MSRLAVIIPSFKSNERILYKVLSRLFESRNIDIRIVIVVDYGTSPNVLERIRSRFGVKLKILKLKHDPGLQYMRVLGAYYALKYYDADIVAFIDNDVLLFPDTLYKMIKILNKYPFLAAVSPLMINDTIIPWMTSIIDSSCFAIWEIPFIKEVEKGVLLTSYTSGACFLIRTSILRKVGYGSKAMRFWLEDADIGLRIWREGLKPAVVLSSIALHLYGFSRRSLDSKSYAKKTIEDHYVGRIKCIYRNFSIGTFLLGLVIVIIDALRFHVLKSIRGFDGFRIIYSIKGLIRGLMELRCTDRVALTGDYPKEIKSLMKFALGIHFRIILKLLDIDKYSKLLRAMARRVMENLRFIT